MLYYELDGESRKLLRLISLPGIGRKTANLIMGDVHHLPAIVTDTHCIRITGRLRLTDSTEPQRLSRTLLSLFLLKSHRISAIGLLLSGESSARQEVKM